MAKQSNRPREERARAEKAREGNPFTAKTEGSGKTMDPFSTHTKGSGETIDPFVAHPED